MICGLFFDLGPSDCIDRTLGHECTLSRSFNMEYFKNAAELFRHEQSHNSNIGPAKILLNQAPVVSDDSLFFLQNGLVFRKAIDKKTNMELKQIVVQESLRYEIMIAFHEHLESGHSGRDKTLEAIKKRFYWQNMDTDISDWVKTCSICQMRNQGILLKLPTMTIPPAMTAFEFVAIDIVGPLIETRKGNKYILVFTDFFTRWPEAFPLANQTEYLIAKCLINEIFCRYGCPRVLLSDRGTNFLSAIMRAVYEIFLIEKRSTTPYNPKYNA